ncbi:iron complex transport system permease protein [Neorhizobium huautlense]|uniref:Iron complex transport system permease protein n=1 Tax=Neorhizobium huautlense TaxID=67774 RepID=A0ABT9PNN0_9HYPH|nr:iron ABC transporter permease [Neorhizobium huautlense]MDP9835489.1 iron complex transport system permease protein [Neorhizobium huautlense]
MAFFLLCGLHLTAGARFSAPALVFDALFDHDPRNYQHVVVIKQRLTRLVVAGYVGAVLAVSGLLLQKILRNDLVSPSTLGINSGAVAFVIFGIYLFGLNGAALFWPALIGGFAAVAVAFLAAGLVSRGRRDPLSLILGGAMTATLFSSATTFVISLDPDRFGNLMGWLVGDIGNFDYLPLAWLWPVGVTGIGFALVLCRQIDLLTLGTEQAATLGADPRLVRAGTLALAIPLAISAVCVVGPIGFVGLVAPHITRLLIGETGRPALGFCTLCGAVIVIAADIAARTLLAPQLLQVGTVMALCGGIAFLVIVVATLRRRAA